ncbi:MAG: NlpC/P60 family protein [Paracoccaceae bacterium]
MDRRITPANDRVAHVSLKGRVAGLRFVTGEWRRVTAPLADLLAAPGGARDRQLLMGARVCLLDLQGDHAFVQAEADGYVGYVGAHALGPDRAPSHWVSAPATHLYPAPDIKTPEIARLSLGAELTVKAGDGVLAETTSGAWLPRGHLRALDDPATDPVGIAEMLLGTPYLWGGNSRDGIDCSGLVQVAHRLCGIACPADSDMQERGLGHALSAETPLRRGDLVFWKGHGARQRAGRNRSCHGAVHAGGARRSGCRVEADRRTGRWPGHCPAAGRSAAVALDQASEILSRVDIV